MNLASPIQPKDEGYKTQGNAPVYGMLRDAADRAKAAGVKDVEQRSIVGSAVDALVELVDEVKADFLVVGNVVGNVGVNRSRAAWLDRFLPPFLVAQTLKCWSLRPRIELDKISSRRRQYQARADSA